MSEGFQFFDIIFLAMLAGFVVLRLRSVLGRRTGNERPPAEEAQGRYNGRPVQGPAADKAAADAALGIDVAAAPADYRLVLENASPASDGVEAIRQKDRHFNLDAFVRGAGDAYDLILNGFWSGDRDSFRPFVSREVYDQFDQAIRGREEDGISLQNSIEQVERIEVVDARLHGSMAEITLRFHTEAVFVTLDGEGRVIEGNPVDRVKVEDVWTFERDLTSNDPSWILISTASEDA